MLLIKGESRDRSIVDWIVVVVQEGWMGDGGGDCADGLGIVGGVNFERTSFQSQLR